MQPSRSDAVYENWRQSTEKFDYFVLGVLGALCAYLSQTYTPSRIGINPGTVELLALLTLVLAGVFGFRRIESINVATMINQQLLHANERRGVLVEVLHKGPALNTQTGQTYTPEYAASEIPKLSTRIKALEPGLREAQLKAERSYKVRNWLTLVGFALIIAAKLFSAYAEA